MKLKIRIFFWRLAVKLWLRTWYTITQILTRKRIELPTFESTHAIAEHLKFGKSYVEDPLRGQFDMLRHPTQMEYRLKHGEDIGDCDDHAGYWIQALYRSKLGRNCHLGVFFMKDLNGKFSGHAVAVFRDDQKRYWADYNDPYVFEDDWQWAEDSAKRYGAFVTHAALFSLDGVTESGRLKFRSVKIHVWDN